MDLTDSDIEDFIRAWKEDFGEELTPDQARFEAAGLLEFFEKLDIELCKQLMEKKEKSEE